MESGKPGSFLTSPFCPRNKSETQNHSSTNFKNWADKTMLFKSNYTALNFCSSRNRGWEEESWIKQEEQGEISKLKEAMFPWVLSQWILLFTLSVSAEVSQLSVNGSVEITCLCRMNHTASCQFSTLERKLSIYLLPLWQEADFDKGQRIIIN